MSTQGQDQGEAMTEEANESVTLIAVGDVMMQSRPRQLNIAAVSALFPQPSLVLANIDVVVSELATPTPK